MNTKIRMKRYFLGAIQILLLAAAGCSLLPEPVVYPTPLPPTNTPELFRPDIPTPTEESAVVKTETPVGEAAELCRPPADLDLPETGPFVDLPRTFLQFLNAGGDPDTIEQYIESAGLAVHPISFHKADLTGDGRLDILVSIGDPESPVFPPEGRLAIYVCGLGRYDLAMNQQSGPASGAPEIRMVEELNADGRPEIVVVERNCGAHTCFEKVQILNWNGTVFQDRLAGITDDLPFPDLAITDPDGDGVFEVAITAGGVGSVGAGPQRQKIRLWLYEAGPGEWVLKEERLADPVFRVHVLHDADAALRRGEYETALLGYQRVIEDEELMEWQQPEIERDNLRAFAYYRIAWIYTVLGDENSARAIMLEMESEFGGASPQRDYLELAIFFRNAYASGGLEAGCNAVTGMAASFRETILEPLGQVVYGYENPNYELEDLCYRTVE